MAGTESDCLAEAVEIRPGVRGQSGSRGRPGGADLEQKGHSDDGGHFDSRDVELNDAALGAVEHAGSTDLAVGRRPERAGFL